MGEHVILKNCEKRIDIDFIAIIFDCKNKK